jgi:hypothetical protein
MGEENIIDSIPLAEADLIAASEEAGTHVQNVKGRDFSSWFRSNHLLGRMESFHSLPESGEVTSTHPQIFAAGLKRIHSNKVCNQQSNVTQSKPKEDPAKTKRSVLQISTIPDGFNSGHHHFLSMLKFRFTKRKKMHSNFSS